MVALPCVVSSARNVSFIHFLFSKADRQAFGDMPGTDHLRPIDF